MGFPNYVKRRIPNILHLNTLTYTLRELLQNGIDFRWTEVCNKAYE